MQEFYNNSRSNIYYTTVKIKFFQSIFLNIDFTLKFLSNFDSKLGIILFSSRDETIHETILLEKLEPFEIAATTITSFRSNWTNSKRNKMFFLSINEIVTSILFFFFFRHSRHHQNNLRLRRKKQNFFLFFFFLIQRGFKRRTIFWFFTARWNSRFPVIEPRSSRLYRKHQRPDRYQADYCSRFNWKYKRPFCSPPQCC